MVELNRKDVDRGVERAAHNLKRGIFIRGPVNLRLVEEHVRIPKVNRCFLANLLVQA